MLGLVTTLAFAGPAMAPLPTGAGSAVAGDLDDRKSANDRDLEHAHDELELTSEGLQRATAALLAAEEKLDTAERALASTRTQLTAAEVLDAQVQRELDEAVAALAEARRQLRQERKKLERRRGDLGSLAAASYQTADTQLMRLTALLNARDVSTVTVQLNTARNLLDKELTGLDRMRASEVLLTVTEEQVTEFKQQVAARRAAAAANLVRIQALESEAEAEAARVERFVEAREAARASAEKAKQRDLAMLAELEQERARIGELLRKRAEAARRRAEAEARRQAAAEARREAARKAAASRSRASGSSRSSSGSSSSGSSGSASSSTGGVLGYPVDGYITSSFGYRTHPIYGYRSFHDGVDFGAGRCGVPIRAAASGQVVSRYYQTAYGNRLIVDHGLIGGAGVATIYNHASRYVVSAGQNVSRGQVIGYVGDTGWSTGCHLHFTVLRNGSAVDPIGYF